MVNWAFNRVVDRAGVQGGSRARRRHRCVWLCTRVTTASVTEPRMLTPTHHVAVVAACCADLKQAKDVAVGGPSLRYRLSVRAFLGRARSSAADPRSAPRRRVRKIGARRPSRGASTCRVQFQAKYAKKQFGRCMSFPSPLFSVSTEVTMVGTSQKHSNSMGGCRRGGRRLRASLSS